MSEEREVISWTDEEAWLKCRAVDITSTESASLFGYQRKGAGGETAFELACRKDGKTGSRFKPSERTEIGKEIEWAIATRAARQFGVRVTHKTEYIRINSARMGASFDYEVIGITDDSIEDNRLRRAFGTLGPGLMEVKNVDSLIFRDQWNIGKNPEAAAIDEAPSHIEIQLQHQLEVCQLAWGAIVVFVGGNRIEIILRLRDAAVGYKLRLTIANFWEDLALGKYPPVTLPEDLSVIKLLNSHAEPGDVFDARGNDEIAGLLNDYLAAHKAEKAAGDRKDTAQAKLLQMIGKAERVVADNATISCGAVGPCAISYTRKGYRNFRVTQRKDQK